MVAILTQDRKAIVLATDVVFVDSDIMGDTYEIIANQRVLGVYHTIERAKQILDEIHQVIHMSRELASYKMPME